MVVGVGRKVGPFGGNVQLAVYGICIRLAVARTIGRGGMGDYSACVDRGVQVHCGVCL